jgi:hypothetical protein
MTLSERRREGLLLPSGEEAPSWLEKYTPEASGTGSSGNFISVYRSRTTRQVAVEPPHSSLIRYTPGGQASP